VGSDSGLPAGEFRISGGDTLSLASFEFDDGQPFIPFFTSLDALTETVSGEAGYLSLQARKLMESTRGNSLVLNPGHEIAKEFTPEEVSRLLGSGPVNLTEMAAAMTRDARKSAKRGAFPPVEGFDTAGRCQRGRHFSQINRS